MVHEQMKHKAVHILQKDSVLIVLWVDVVLAVEIRGLEDVD